MKVDFYKYYIFAHPVRAAFAASRPLDAAYWPSPAKTWHCSVPGLSGIGGLTAEGLTTTSQSLMVYTPWYRQEVSGLTQCRQPKPPVIFIFCASLPPCPFHYCVRWHYCCRCRAPPPHRRPPKSVAIATVDYGNKGDKVRFAAERLEHNARGFFCASILACFQLTYLKQTSVFNKLDQDPSHLPVRQQELFVVAGDRERVGNACDLRTQQNTRFVGCPPACLF